MRSFGMPPASRGTKDPMSASDAERRGTGAANAAHTGERNSTKEKKETAVTKAKDKYKHFSNYLYSDTASNSTEASETVQTQCAEDINVKGRLRTHLDNWE